MKRPVAKIGQLVLSLELGGLERLVVDFVGSLDRSEFDISLACLGPRGILAREVEKMGIAVESFGWRGGLAPGLVPRIARWIKREGIDILHTHNSAPHFYGSLAARLCGGRKVVHTKHGRDWPDMPRKVLLNRISSALSARVVTVSRNAYRIAREVEKVPERKLMVIYNGIDLSRFSREESASGASTPAGLPPNAPIVGTVARLSPEKDQKTLLEAFALVAKRDPRCILAIAGDGPARRELETLRDRLPCRERILFLGRLDDVAGLLGSLSVFALTSETEGISLALLEAGACRIPAVVTDVGGNGEVVIDGETGFLVPPGAPEPTAEKILRLLSDEEMRRRMGEKARARVEERFALDGMTASYSEVYRQLSARR